PGKRVAQQAMNQHQGRTGTAAQIAHAVAAVHRGPAFFDWWYFRLPLVVHIVLHKHFDCRRVACHVLSASAKWKGNRDVSSYVPTKRQTGSGKHPVSSGTPRNSRQTDFNC